MNALLGRDPNCQLGLLCSLSQPWHPPFLNLSTLHILIANTNPEHINFTDPIPTALWLKHRKT
jgi:hypothetical protein